MKENHPKLFNFTGFKKEEGGLLYRLDNETNGLVLFAKTKEAFENFINDQNLEKIYIAKVTNPPLTKKGTINFQIAHKSSKRMVALIPNKKINFQGKAKNAETKYEILKNNLIKCFIKKGLRHQIRVHLSAINCPIVGDDLYSKNGNNANELHLSCVGIKSKNLDIDVAN